MIAFYWIHRPGRTRWILLEISHIDRLSKGQIELQAIDWAEHKKVGCIAVVEAGGPSSLYPSAWRLPGRVTLISAPCKAFLKDWKRIVRSGRKMWVKHDPRQMNLFEAKPLAPSS